MTGVHCSNPTCPSQLFIIVKMNTVSSGNSFLGHSGICINRLQEKKVGWVLHYLLCVGQVEENMG